MDSNDKILELQKQIAAEQNKMANCHHVFGKTYSDPESVSEPYGSRLIGHGSDAWYEPEGYRVVSVPRWARKCTLCGKIEYTYKQKPIISDYQPDFS